MSGAAGLREAEWIGTVYFLSMAFLAWLRPLDSTRRAAATWWGLVGVAMVLLGRLSAGLAPPAVSRTLRDWIPGALLLVAYWQAGRFFVAPDLALQRRLLALDERLLGGLLRASRSRSPGRALALGGELSYLLCYVLPPGSLAALYVLGLEGHIDRFWTLVLVPAFLSYATVAFLPTLPPRALPGHREEEHPGAARRFNLWFLDHTSIQANTFPSGHVATSFATALALLHLAPPPAGLGALAGATAIAIATVVGRYHYLADAVLAIALAGAWFLLALALGAA